MGSLALNISFLTYSVATVAYALLLGLIIQKDQYKDENRWLFVAVVSSVVWAFAHAASAVSGAYTTNLVFLAITYSLPFLNWLKGVLWIIFLYNHLRLIWNSQDNGHLSIRVGRILTTLITVGFLVELISFSESWGVFERGILGVLPVYNKLLVAFSVLLLVENLYRNIAYENRWGIRFFCLGLGSIYAFEFLLYSDSILYSIIDEQLYEAKGVVNIIVVPLMALAVARGANWSVGLSLTRQAAFHMISLVMGVLYLIGISVLGYYIQRFGGDWGKILQVGFLFAAFVGFVVIIYSGKIRSTLLVLLNKYFFISKFDYREEWLRFIQTMTATEDHYNLQERSIKAVANIMDSRGGALWYLDQPDRYTLSARWNFRHDIEEELEKTDPFAIFMRDNHWIVNLGDIEQGKIPNSDCMVPKWLSSEDEFWLVIPLIHHKELKGFILLYQPRAARVLNWETIDLLRTVSFQIASYLVEQENFNALGVASEFEAFNRKFAFVIHDIKNMASQLSLLNKNAEKHGDNPEFQKDMKLTVENTVEKMNDLLSRINIVQEPSKSKNLSKINIDEIVGARVAKFVTAGQHVEYKSSGETFAISNEEDLDTAISHVIQNAIDASNSDEAVKISLKQDEKFVILRIKDNGEGMEEEFIRNELFRPFRSLKEGGYGIGAYESRQLIENMGGRMKVKSQPGKGTLVSIYLKKEN